MHSPSRSAFTLVELSIVLVILGLLVGGVLAGQSLILSAQRKKVMTQWDELNTTVNAFKLKYLMLPGDLNIASSYFPGYGNGDGNGLVWTVNSSFGHSGYGYEYCHFFSHLSAAGLIAGTYPPCTGGPTVHGRTPPLPLAPNTSYVVTAECVATDCNATDGPRRNGHWIWTQGLYNNTPSIWLAATVATHVASNPFTPEDAYWLDMKMDDGRARTGNVQMMREAGQRPADNDQCIDTAQSTEYKLTETRRLCYLKAKTTF